MERAAWVGLGWLFGASACAGGANLATADDGTAPNPPLAADEPLRQLTAAEAKALCEWESTLLARGHCLQDAILAGGFRAQISADPAAVANARNICDTELQLCVAPDRVAAGILDCAKQVQTGFTQCAVDVSAAEACDHDLARDFAAQPDCGALTEENFRQVLYRTPPASCQHSACGS